MKITKFTIMLLVLSIFAFGGVFVYQKYQKDGRVLGADSSCTPISFRKEDRGGTYYLVWNTTQECIGYVKFSTNTDSFPYYGVNNKGQVKTKNHEILLSGVEKNNKYYFVIISGDKTYGKSGLPLEITF